MVPFRRRLTHLQTNCCNHLRIQNRRSDITCSMVVENKSYCNRYSHQIFHFILFTYIIGCFLFRYISCSSALCSTLSGAGARGKIFSFPMLYKNLMSKAFLARYPHSVKTVCLAVNCRNFSTALNACKNSCIAERRHRCVLRHMIYDQDRCLLSKSPITPISRVPAPHFSSVLTSVGMELQEVLSSLRQFAPESLAESWDNVGLLVEPTPPHIVRRILLTNDLTPAVVEEAVASKSDMVLSYHPPIFAALKRVTQKSWKERLVVRCVENRIAVYSPHTAYDALSEGVNDWLISAFDVVDVEPITTSKCSGTLSHRVTGSTTQSRMEAIQTALLNEKGCVGLPVSFLPQFRPGDGPTKIEVSVACAEHQLGTILTLLQTFQVSSLVAVELCKVPMSGTGMGRRGRLTQALTPTEAVEKVKAHLKLPHLRLAANPDKTSITSVAVCAGSGSSVLRGAKADLYLTGEMSHHDVLEAVYGDGANVLLCDHSNTERGFLTVLASSLSEVLGKKVDIAVSQRDADPLVVV